MDSNSAVAQRVPDKNAKTYYPLVLIFIYLIGAIVVTSYRTGDFTPATLMNHFMGGFFIIFSFFKLLDLKGFAKTFRTYDVIAKAIPTYGSIYPFIELGLGALYLGGFQPLLTNIATVIVMAASSIGVIQSLINRRKIKCACLGAVFNLPMSTITLIEDALMLAMAAAMTFLLTNGMAT